jgi:hypothetical protein
MTNRKFKYHTAAYFPEWEEAQPYSIKHIDSRGSAEKITIINYTFELPGPDQDSGIVIPRLE